MKTEAEVGVILLTSQGTPRATEARKRQGRILFQRLCGEHGLDNSCGFQNCENINFWFKPPSLWYLVMEAWKRLEFSFCIFNLFYLLFLYLKVPLPWPPQLRIMLLFIALRLFSPFWLTCLDVLYMYVPCSSTLKLCSFCAKLLLGFQLPHSWRLLFNWDHWLTEHLFRLKHRIMWFKIGENNTALGPVKYLTSISCPPAPYYLHLYWHLTSLLKPFPTWFTILVNYSIRLLFPQASDLGFIFDCSFSHNNQSI